MGLKSEEAAWALLKFSGPRKTVLGAQMPRQSSFPWTHSVRIHPLKSHGSVGEASVRDVYINSSQAYPGG